MRRSVYIHEAVIVKTALCRAQAWGMRSAERRKVNGPGPGTNVIGGRVRGKPRLGWIDGMKVTLGSRETTVPSVTAKQRNIGRSGAP